MMSEVVVCPCESSKSHFQAFPREGSLSHFFCKGSWAPKSKKSHFFARAPFAKKADSRAPLRREPRKNASFHAHTRIFIKKMTPRNPTPTESKDQAMGQRERAHLSGPQLAVRGDTATRSTTYRLAIAGRTLLLSRPACRSRPARHTRKTQKKGRVDLRLHAYALRCFGYCPARVRTRQ